jgi:hypothetical protein
VARLRIEKLLSLRRCVSLGLSNRPELNVKNVLSMNPFQKTEVVVIVSLGLGLADEGRV